MIQRVYGGHFDIEVLKSEIEVLQKKTEDINFWNDRNNAEQIIKEITDKKSTVSIIEDLKLKISDNLEIIELLELEPDNTMQLNLEEFANNLDSELNKLNLVLLLNGPHDKNNCIVDIHSGAGGTEACDWAMMLYRMYTRWCEKKKYKIELLDYQDGEEAGIKSVSMLVKGINAYGYLKTEKGVHRLVRLSPFDSSNRRHTSFASVEVTPEIDQDNSIEIDEKDLKEKLEKLTKEEFGFDSFVKINGDTITITIDSGEHDYNLANDVIRCVSSYFKSDKYISVKFN